MTHACRNCGATLSLELANLGVQPLSNAYVDPRHVQEPEPRYPLVAYVCEQCLLMQVPPVTSRETLFADYAYFSSYSESWLEHARAYAAMMRERLQLGATSQVIEIASNDGYLLQYFQRDGIPVLGIEPAANVAEVAREKGIETCTRFFGVDVARTMAGRADLLIANNVLAHVPDLHDFIEGLRIALAPNGTLTIEVPHLLRLIEGRQFDTIYHEHYSAFSLRVMRDVLAQHGLAITEVVELATHGGSLRVFAQHEGAAIDASVGAVLDIERSLTDLETYRRFSADVELCKRELVEFLTRARAEGKSVAGYGAPAKGNTLLNSCGVGVDLIAFTVDRNPHKQGLLLPGSHIPIYAPSKLDEMKPDYVVILPWNLRDEIVAHMAHIRDWGGRFVVPIPRIEVLA
ncbi:MAG TPA: class I SAM-dependent methyltransferase [Thermoanaerobaculia bacterium]